MAILEKKTNVHFVGINGSGISGVACIAKERGFNVTGCDVVESGDYSVQLIKNDIKISVGHDLNHIKDVDIVVLSPALLYKDRYKKIEETKVAMETRKTIKWQKFLGDYIMNKQNVVAVSGTHGKTTTTTLISLMLEKGNFDPTVFVGGVVKEWGQSYRVGKSNYYVCEGDEYDGNFLNYFPKYVILNNLEMEHPERFADFEDYKNNFKEFLKTIQNNGKIVFYYDDESIMELISEFYGMFKEKNIKLIGYTFNTRLKKIPGNIELIKVKKEKNKIKVNGNIFEFILQGDHNIKNISIATIMALELGVKVEAIQEVLKSFSGSKRRMDLIFLNDKVKLYDDYAHHHTQIRCTLEALKSNLSIDEKLIVVLEPHLISRIKNNTKEYKDALMLADYPIITKIYKSRENFMEDLDINKLFKNKIPYIEEFENIIDEIHNIIEKNKKSKFTIIIMGAGNSYKIANNLKESFS